VSRPPHFESSPAHFPTCLQTISEAATKTISKATTTPPQHTRQTANDKRHSTLVKCHTTAADGAPFVLEIKEEWAPLGAQRFLDLVKSGYFAGVPFFRVVPGR